MKFRYLEDLKIYLTLKCMSNIFFTKSFLIPIGMEAKTMREFVLRAIFTRKSSQEFSSL